jgi:hypothetical protein
MPSFLRLGRLGRFLHEKEFNFTAADDMGAAVVAHPTLEGLHFEQAREALVRGAAHPHGAPTKGHAGQRVCVSLEISARREA